MFTCHRLLTPFLAAAVLVGCALPAHNNTLIFAVKRDVNLSVNTPSAAEPEFSVNLGYKERQAAWVPLWANEKTGGFGEKTAMECTQGLGSSACMRSAKFVGDSEPGTRGNDAHDAYSTFASFGGKVDTRVEGGSATVAQVNGNLASFFATGVAAQHLAKDASKMDLAGVRSDQDAKKSTPEQEAQRLQKAVQADTRKSLETFFQMTAVYSNSTPTLATVNPDCLGKLAKDMNAKEPPDLSWVKGRNPEDAANALLTLSGMLLTEQRKLAAAANDLSSKIAPELATFDATHKDKPEERTPSKRATKAAQICTA